MNLKDSYIRWKKILLSLKQHERRFSLLEANVEHLVNEQYKAMSPDHDQKTRLMNKEYSIFSQNGEDGILLYLFSLIGTTNCKAIEFGIGDGRQCNTANLITNFGWEVLMIEGHTDKARSANTFYRKHPKTKEGQVTIKEAFITTENINALFSENGYTGEIDLLSIDIDGNDYWIWEAVRVINPRVVVIEYNASLGPEKSISVTYDPEFDRYKKHPSGWYHGASLKALEHLGKAKGYRLVGCDSNGVNAFFVRSDIPAEELNELTADEAYFPEKKRSRTHTTAEQYALIRDLEFTPIPANP